MEKVPPCPTHRPRWSNSSAAFSMTPPAPAIWSRCADQKRNKRRLVGKHHIADHRAAFAGPESVFELSLLQGLDGGRRDHATVDHHADPPDPEPLMQSIHLCLPKIPSARKDETWLAAVVRLLPPMRKRNLSLQPESSGAIRVHDSLSEACSGFTRVTTPPVTQIYVAHNRLL